MSSRRHFKLVNVKSTRFLTDTKKDGVHNYKSNDRTFVHQVMVLG